MDTNYQVTPSWFGFVGTGGLNGSLFLVEGTWEVPSLPTNPPIRLQATLGEGTLKPGPVPSLRGAALLGLCARWFSSGRMAVVVKWDPILG